MKQTYSFTIITMLIVVNLFAGKNKNPIQSNYKPLAAGCSPSTGKAQLDINNVRTTILASSDMWWDLNTARYEVPKGGGAHSVFAGSIWIGGRDAGNNIHVAAQNYRQGGGVDFYTGPIDTTNSSVSQQTCSAYDRVWKVDRTMVNSFINNFGQPGNVVPKDIMEWPGNGNVANGEARYLAPFYDSNADGIYNYQDGDYPGYDLTGGCDGLKGQQTLWWVFNDVGNVHGETGGSPLGVEIRAQAFAFITNDENNNHTFYEYTIINRSTNTYYDTYIAQFMDADVGSYDDDYVGCDVSRGMGYAYNGDGIDGNGQVGSYGNYPVAVGYDFLGGPLADAHDGKDNDHDSIIDEAGECIVMSKFMYYNNDATVTGDPSTAQGYYNYMQGLWKDGKPVLYAGNSYSIGYGPCDYMFPGNTDPYGWGTNGVIQAPWDDSGNMPSDRRFVMSAGPFTFQPGAIQKVTGVLAWAQTDTAGGNLRAVELLKVADDKAQLAFDNCFAGMVSIGNKKILNEMASKLFPNPLTDHAILNFKNPLNESCQVSIYTTNGLFVRSYTNITNEQLKIEREELTAGIYFYHITNAKGDNLGLGKMIVE